MLTIKTCACAFVLIRMTRSISFGQRVTDASVTCDLSPCQAKDRSGLACRTGRAADSAGGGRCRSAIGDRALRSWMVDAERIIAAIPPCGACVADEAPTLIWATDADGRARLRQTGGSRTCSASRFPDLQGDGWGLILVPDAQEDFRTRLNWSIAERQPFQAEVQVRIVRPAGALAPLRGGAEDGPPSGSWSAISAAMSTSPRVRRPRRRCAS